MPFSFDEWSAEDHLIIMDFTNVFFHVKTAVYFAMITWYLIQRPFYCELKSHDEAIQ